MRLMGRIGIALALLILIMDSKYALESASAGVDLVIHTVIPALFPFFVLSGLLTSIFENGIVLSGLLGGYPVGAQAISQAYSDGRISKEQAKRLLPVCNQCGPAFIFGMAGVLFKDVRICFALWGVQILSSMVTAWIIGGGKPSPPASSGSAFPSPAALMRKSITALSSVCGWIIIFRMIYGFLERWILWVLPQTLQAGICGLLELANGCSALSKISDTTLQFQLCAITMSFGGICVMMQVFSVCHPDISKSYYFPGKVLQSAICGLLVALLLRKFTVFTGILVMIGTICVIIFRIQKKTVAFPSKRVYNSAINDTRILPCSLEKRFPAPAHTAHEAP